MGTIAIVNNYISKVLPTAYNWLLLKFYKKSKRHINPKDSYLIIGIKIL